MQPQEYEAQLLQDEEIEDQEDEMPDADEFDFIANMAQSQRMINKGGVQVMLGERQQPVAATGQQEQDDPFAVVQDQGDQYGATKPWKGAIIKPSQAPQTDFSPPQINLQLEFVNGLNAFQLSQMMFQVDQENIVYPAALLGIKMNKNTLEQSFLGGGTYVNSRDYHTDDIVALDYIKDLDLAVSGSIGKNPQICVWRPSDMSLVVKFRQGKDTRAATAVRLSRDGKFVYSTCKSNKPKLRAFSTQDGSQLAQHNLQGSALQMAAGAEGVLAIAQARCAQVFTFDGSAFDRRQRIYGKSSSVCFDQGDLYIGMADGSILGKVQQKGYHQGVIFAIKVHQGKVYTTGSKDKLLKVANLGLQVQKQIQLDYYAKSIDVLGQNILLSQANGKIVQVSGQDQKVIMNGHFAGQVWGLAVHDGMVVSSADDNKVLVFDTATKRVVNQIKINQVGKKGLRKASTLSPFPQSKQSRAVAINPVNGNLAIATNHGQVQLFQSVMSTQYMKRVKPTKDWCQIMRFSPDGTKLAVGFHDRVIRIYDDTLKGKYKLRGHSSFITNIDWSTDSTYLRTVSGAYQLLYWNTENGKRLTKNVDTQWATQGRFGWNTQPLWKQIVDGSFVNGLDLSKDRQFLAVGQDDGCVRIYRNPVAYKKCIKFKNHSSHVVKLQWSSQDQKLMTVGGYDKTMMICRVAK